MSDPSALPRWVIEWIYRRVEPTKGQWLNLLRIRPLKTPTVLYRGLEWSSRTWETRRENYGVHESYNSWTGSIWIAKGFGGASARFGVVLSREFLPGEAADIAINMEQEFLAPPGNYKVKVVEKWGFR